MGQAGLHWSERALLDPTAPPPRGPLAARPSMAGAPRAGGRSRKKPVIFALVALLVVAAGVTAFLFISAKNASAAEQKAIAAALAQMGTYTDYTTGVSFQVPTSWDQIPLENAENALGGMGGFGAMPSAFVAFGQGGPATGDDGPGSFMMFAAQDYPGGSSGYTVKQVLEQSVDQVNSFSIPGFSVEGGVKKIEGIPLDGAEVTFKATTGGETALLRLCFLDSGSCFYIFMFAADEITWEKSRYFFEGTVDTFSQVGV